MPDVRSHAIDGREQLHEDITALAVKLDSARLTSSAGPQEEAARVATQAVARTPPTPPTPSPEKTTAAAPRTPALTDVKASNNTTTVITLRDRIVQLSSSPLLFLVDGLLDEATCAAIVAGCGSLMSASPVGVVSRIDKSIRDSDSRFLDASHSVEVRRALESMTRFAETAAEIARRCAGGRGAEGKLKPTGSSCELIRYKPGQKFKEHHDHSDVYKRTLSVVVYLTSNGGSVDGGGTIFPKARVEGGRDAARSFPEGVEERPGGGGLRVGPRVGRAVAFFNTDVKGMLDDASKHAAEEVKAGVKHVLTKFYVAAGR